MALPPDYYSDRAKRILSIAHDCAHQANPVEVSPVFVLPRLRKAIEASRVWFLNPSQ